MTYAKVESAGNNHGNFFKVHLNNVEQTISAGDGINIVRINKNTGAVIESRSFDTGTDFA